METQSCNLQDCRNQIFYYRDAKFKIVLILRFLNYFTKHFFHFLTSELESDTDMMNPSIESSDFLFKHEENLDSFCGKQTKSMSRIEI